MGPYRHSLNVIRIDRPCEEPWDRMQGDSKMRFCRTCSSHVYDLSQLTLAEAESLIELTNGSACVRLYQRADGTVVTKDDCAPDTRRARRRRWIGGAAMAAAVGASVAGVGLVALPAAPHARPPCPRAAPTAAPARGEPEGAWVMGATEGEWRARREPMWVDPATLPSPFGPRSH